MPSISHYTVISAYFATVSSRFRKMRIQSTIHSPQAARTPMPQRGGRYSNWRHRHFRIHRKILLLYPNGLWSNISGGLPTGSPYNSANVRVFFMADCQRYSPSPTCDTVGAVPAHQVPTIERCKTVSRTNRRGGRPATRWGLLEASLLVWVCRGVAASESEEKQ